MSDTPKISDEMAIAAKQYLEDVALGKIDVKDKYEWNRFLASKDLYRFYQTQEKFGPARIKELADMPNGSQDVKDYAALTDEELEAKVSRISDYPRKSG